MKNILLFITFCLFSLSLFAQSIQIDILEVDNATTAFGKGLKVGSLVYNKGTNTFFEITAFADSTKTLTTATTEAIADTGVVTAHSDISSAGSGIIITAGERTSIGDVTTHRTINDSGASTTDLLSASKILSITDAFSTVASETYAATDARFFGEFGLPSTQGFTDTATGSAAISNVNETVFDVVKQVVKHDDDVADGSTTSHIDLTAQNWTDINGFGSSFSGVSRLDTVNGGNGFFTGLQANAAENPLATGNRRYGIVTNNNAGNLRLIEADNTGNNVTMDGTGGNPLILFDEWYGWEVVVPTGLGAAQFYINGDLTTFVPTFFVNGGGLGTRVIIGSGSTGGVDRVTFHDNFGVTIYEESSTKTLLAATMDSDVIRVFYPSGKRDYITILPDGNPRSIGSSIKQVKGNIGGTITLTNEDLGAPQILYNSLRTLVVKTDIEETVTGVNTIDNGNVYIGFGFNGSHTGGWFVDTTDQIIGAINTPQDVTFDTTKIIEGMSHTAGSATFTINMDGIYEIKVFPQLAQGSGAATVEFWIEKNGTNIVDSNAQESISANQESLPVLNWKERFVATDTYKIIWASSSLNTKLDNITSAMGGPNIVSIMHGITKVGN